MPRHHALLQGVRLFVFDYDKTLARTDLPSPHGLTVEKAYAIALDRIFGTTGLLQELGGLRNRAPGEIAHAALLHGASLEHAIEYHLHHRVQLLGLVPHGKGVDLAHACDAHENDDFCAELLTRVKLLLLCDEVGTYSCGHWPAPCDGVPEFFRALGERPAGIISSGHDAFIEKSFECWGIPCPRFRVTDDDFRGNDLPLEEKTKPSPRLVTRLLYRVRKKAPEIDLGNVLYIGDDPHKDGKLAENAGIPFLWYNADGQPSRNGIPEFRDWSELAREL